MQHDGYPGGRVGKAVAESVLRKKHGAQFQTIALHKHVSEGTMTHQFDSLCLCLSFMIFTLADYQLHMPITDSVCSRHCGLQRPCVGSCGVENQGSKSIHVHLPAEAPV